MPRNRGRNQTLLASMTSGGLGPCLAVEGATTKAVFETYVEQVLATSLRPGQVVILDNLSSHKGEWARELIEGQYCSLLFLPPYSQDFSPIEEAYSKIKALLKKSAARARGALLEVIGRAISAVTLEDAVWATLATAATCSPLNLHKNRCSIVGTACRLHDYDERDGRGVHLRALAQLSPRSAAVQAYEQCSSNEQRCAKLRVQRIGWTLSSCLLAGACMHQVPSRRSGESRLQEIGYRYDKSANGDRGDEVPRKRWTG